MLSGHLPILPMVGASARDLRHHRLLMATGRLGPWVEYYRTDEGQHLAVARPVEGPAVAYPLGVVGLDPTRWRIVLALGNALRQALSPIAHVLTLADFSHEIHYLAEDRANILAQLPPQDDLTVQAQAEHAGFTCIDPDVMDALRQAQEACGLHGLPLTPADEALLERIERLRAWLAPTDDQGAGWPLYTGEYNEWKLPFGVINPGRTPGEVRQVEELMAEAEQHFQMMGEEPQPQAVYLLSDVRDARAFRLNARRRRAAFQEGAALLTALAECATAPQHAPGTTMGDV